MNPVALNRAAARAHLVEVMRRVVEVVEEYAKRRDRREPGRQEKEQAEADIQAWVERYWRRQARRVREHLETYYPDRKALGDVPPPDDFYEDLFEDGEEEQRLIAQLIALLQDAARGGIALFGRQSLLQIDWTLTNTRAAEWARNYTYELVRGINETTREALQAQISAFVETPGMTLGDLYAGLPFGQERAQQVAVTEVSRSYAAANQIAGEELKKEFPGVRVEKQWFVNEDDIQCEICGALADLPPVEINEKWTLNDEEYENPPAHPRCRCWTETFTALADLD